jgi:hypothetical protein
MAGCPTRGQRLGTSEMEEEEAVLRMQRAGARVAAASDEELAEEAAANGFGVSTYREVVARLVAASTPPGVEWVSLDDILARRLEEGGGP